MEEKDKKAIVKQFFSKKYLKLFPNFKEKKTQAFTTIVLTLITLSVFGLFAINPTLSTIAQLKKQLSDSEFVNSALEQKIINLGVLQNKYTLLRDDMPIVLMAVPQTPTTPYLIGQIQYLAKTHTVSLKRFQVFQVELSSLEKKNIKDPSFAFSLEAQGNFTNLSDFAASLVDFERVITIDVISLSGGRLESEPIRLNIRGKAYFKI